MPNLKPSTKTRAYIYRVLLAGSTVALVYGLVTDAQAAVWLGLSGAVCNVLPTANTQAPRTTRNDDGASVVEVCVVLTLLGVVLLLCGKTF